MGENTVALAALGLVTAVLAAVVKPLFALLRENTKAQNNTATAMQALVEETRKGNREAAERNGHLGEQNIQITELIAKHTEKMTEEFSKVEKTLDSKRATA